jgi:hypothetical protein
VSTIHFHSELLLSSLKAFQTFGQMIMQASDRG